MARVALIAGVVALAVPAVLTAQADSGRPLVVGHSFTIRSRVLDEARTMDVALPAGYDGSTSQRYPVVYVLDAESEMEPATTVARFYAGSGQLPPMIVIGVRNGARTRDLTPAPIAGFAPPPEGGPTGGADKFLQFLTTELMPWVDRRYNAAPMRVLIGHSLGGLFALEVLATAPASFAGYIVMEPSTWWNNGDVALAASRALRQPATRKLRVMLVNADIGGVDTSGMGGDAAMVRMLRVPGETHTSMVLSGMILALRRMFADFKAPRWEPGTRPIAMLAHYDDLSQRLGFAVPIPAAVYEEVFLMSLEARAFDDAEEILARMQRERPSGSIGDLRQMLAAEKATPAPAGLVPLVMAASRPTPSAAARFLGHWSLTGSGEGHEVDIQASGDTILVHERVRLPNGEWTEDDAPVIGLTPTGELEWGQRVFRGIAALLVLRGQLQPDGTMAVMREVRGWVPKGPTGDMLRPETLSRISP